VPSPSPSTSPSSAGPADAGVNHIDTAQFYGPDVANELLHEALHPGSDVPFADQLEEMIALRDVLDQAALHALPS